MTIAVAAILAYSMLSDRLRFETLHEHHLSLIEFRDRNYGLTVALFLAAYVAMVLTTLPALPLTLTGGFLFGLFPGAFFNLGALTGGALLLFLAVRSGLGGPFLRLLRTGSGRMQRSMERIRDNEVLVLLSLRILPGIPLAVGNVLAALVRVPTLRFAWTTALGSLPATFLYTWIGAGLGEILMQDDPSDEALLRDPFVLGALAALALVVILPAIYVFWKQKRTGMARP
ncbi:TVP38/TMEM64 family protein [Halodurantibacterium flavum]|uniref:TVP38/TMEM64 family membrane protein n=1 Tax=Halodurantibacterium flavum TaxID=1382802 RepID=A0ABW4S8Y1_9RHOB